MFNVHARLMPQHVMELYAVIRDVVVGDGPSPSTPEIVSLEATPIHYAQPHDSANEDDSESDSTYVAGSGSSSDTVSEDEYVPETPSGGPDNLLNTGDAEDYNTDGGVKFRVRHNVRNRETVLIAVKNYSIRWNAEYIILESDRLKYHCRCKQFTNGCPWSVRVALRHNLNYCYIEVRRFSGSHTCLIPTMFQDHAQLDRGLICRVVLPIIKTDPSVSILVLQSDVHQSYHFSLHIKRCGWQSRKWLPRFMATGKSRRKGYMRSYKLCRSPSQVRFTNVLLFLITTETWLTESRISLIKFFRYFFPYIEAFKHCKPFVSMDGTHLYGKYRGILLITAAQGNNNILPVAFSLVESETTKSWSFFLSNLRQHVTPHLGILSILDRSQASHAALNTPHSG
ncbi:hypothetical protein Ahy_A02g008850 [Arachis hypogaea]|uniref:MULE transposase domain-containing protein n=1 Tax=Arachis hypogaea TaxID=3818 RepID=A0A445EFK7_ARAHY|nr:hypothetical protein Ahy_A02g008850 [Arachis hypogaea]